MVFWSQESTMCSISSQGNSRCSKYTCQTYKRTSRIQVLPNGKCAHWWRLWNNRWRWQFLLCGQHSSSLRRWRKKNQYHFSVVIYKWHIPKHVLSINVLWLLHIPEFPLLEDFARQNERHHARPWWQSHLQYTPNHIQPHTATTWRAHFAHTHHR